MSMEEFASGPAQSGLLTDREVLFFQVFQLLTFMKVDLLSLVNFRLSQYSCTSL